MNLDEKVRKGRVKRIVEIINETADNGFDEVDLNAYDSLYFSNDMIDDIKSVFNEDALKFKDRTIIINMNSK